MFDYKVEREDGKKGVELDIAEVTVLSYVVPGESPLGDIKLSGSWDIAINEIENTFKKSLLSKRGISCQRNNYLRFRNNSIYVLNISRFQGP